MKSAILIQGRYISEYTLDSIYYYLKSNENIIICLSIWEDDVISDEETDQLKNMKNLYIVYNSKPDIPGIQNVNYQLVSTLNGLLKLKELNCTNVVKTRTDHRVNINKLINIRSDKITVIETDNMINSPFMVCDFLFYSSLENLINIFNVELSQYGENRKTFNDSMKNIHNYIFYYNVAIDYEFELYAERHIIVNYFKSLGYTVPRNPILSRFYSILLIVKHFNMINHNDIDYKALKSYKALNYRKHSFKYYESIVSSKRLLKLFFKVINYEVLEFIRRVSFYPKFLFQLWKIK